jgi:hypothetical protein
LVLNENVTEVAFNLILTFHGASIETYGRSVHSEVTGECFVVANIPAVQ